MGMAKLAVVALGVMALVTYQRNPSSCVFLNRSKFFRTRGSLLGDTLQSRTSQGNSSTASTFVDCNSFAAKNGASFSAILCRSTCISRPIASEYRRSIWIVLRGTLHTTWPDSVFAGTRRACPSQVTWSNNQRTTLNTFQVNQDIILQATSRQVTVKYIIP